MIESNINWDTEIEMECPGCKKKFKIKVKYLSPSNKVKCPGCNNDIDLVGDDIVKIIKTWEKKFKNR